MIRCVLGVAALVAPAIASAAPALGPAYGDGMVLQQGQPITLEGQAQPGDTVQVTFDGVNSSIKAGKDGSFSITLAERATSATGVTLELSDSTGSTRYDEVLIGNVFLCSGQSNMELSVERALDTWNQLRLATDDGIRLLMVPKATAAVPQDSFAGPVAWKSANGETVAGFSAACFYMGKELRRLDPDTPVGLIHSNWGGSAARAWMTPESVRALYGQEALDQLQTYSRDPFEATRAFVPQWFDWWRAQNGGTEPWLNSASLDWKPIPQFSFWNEWKGTGLDKEPRANVWLRQKLTLTAGQAGQHGQLSIGAIDDLDLTFVNGRPVGYTFGWGVERSYRVPAGYLREGENEVLIAANNIWDTGGFFGASDRLFFQPGDGSGPVPLGTDWEYSVAPSRDVPPRAPWDANAGLGVMHNAMIAPLGPMRLAGVAWYQGESDVRQLDYDGKLRALFAGWRRQFGSDARMLVVQLADFGARVSQPVASGWGQLRQEQLAAVQADSNAALVTAIDIGEPTDIHPANKNELGKRLAYGFLGEALPMPLAAKRVGGTVTVSFSGVEGGLIAQSGPYPLGVEICGSTQESCRYAVPRLSGSTMVIALEAGETATRVRYAWSDAPIVNLYDARVLPVPGFELAITP
jgi:sialate O-acetylesterase